LSGLTSAQEQAPDRIAGPPAIEQREPIGDRQARERPARGQPRRRVQAAEQGGDRALERRGQVCEKSLDLGDGGLACGGQEAAGGQCSLGDGYQVVMCGKLAHRRSVAHEWSDH